VDLSSTAETTQLQGPSLAEHHKRLYEIRCQQLAKKRVRRDDEDENGGDDEVEDDGDEDERVRAMKRHCTPKSKEGNNEEDVEQEETIPAQENVQPQKLDTEWGVECDSAIQKESDYIRKMENRHRDLLSLLGPHENPEPRSCFACIFMHNTSAIWAKDWNAVVQYYESSMMCRINYRDLGESLYRMFTLTVVETLKANEAINRDCTYWSPYGILFHFLYHHRDIGRHLWVNFTRVNDMFDTVMSNCVYTEHPASDRPNVSLDDLKKVKMASEVVLMHAKFVKIATNGAAVSSSTSMVPTPEALSKAREVYMPPARKLISKPNFQRTHMQYPH
jgi:hypothetical protein